MSADPDFRELRRLVKRFEELDAGIPSPAAPEPFFDAVVEVMAAKKQVKRWLAAQVSFRAPSDLKRKLQNIRDNEGYKIDKIIKRLDRVLGKPVSQEAEEPQDEDDLDFWDKLTEEQAKYIDVAFLRRRNEAATIIASQGLPAGFAHHLSSLRECYSLGLFDAVIIYCRAVIEAGCFEALRRHGKVRIDGPTPDPEEYSLKALMRAIKPFCRLSWAAANEVIKRADLVLHSKRERKPLSEREAYDALKTTYAIIEELFD